MTGPSDAADADGRQWRRTGGIEVYQRDVPPPDWAALVARVSVASFFYRPLWTEAVARHYPGATPLWLEVRRAGELIGGLAAVARSRHRLRRYASHLDGTSGGPLVASDLSPTDQQEVFGALADRYADLVGGRTVQASISLAADTELRFGSLLSDRGFERRDVSGAVIPLDGGLAYVERHVLSNNRRNERNRAVKRGCSAGSSVDRAKLAEFHAIYRAATRHWGVEPAPLSLLEELAERGEGRAFLIYVEYEDRVIGGHFCVHDGDRLVAWVGATLPEHNRQLFPATLIVWQEIAEGCTRGARYLDLGGSGGIGTLNRFKRLLGADTEVRGHYTLSVPWWRAVRQLRRFVHR